jgi:hypothetical protein
MGNLMAMTCVFFHTYPRRTLNSQATNFFQHPRPCLSNIMRDVCISFSPTYETMCRLKAGQPLNRWGGNV